MKREFEFGGEMTDGRATPYDLEGVVRDLARVFPNGTRLRFKVEEDKGSVTDRQRGYYFAAVVGTAASGFEKLGERDAARYARNILERLSPEMVEQVGYRNGSEILEAPLSLSEVFKDKARTSRHIDWCIQWIAENLGEVVETGEEYYARMYGTKPELGGMNKQPFQ